MGTSDTQRPYTNQTVKRRQARAILSGPGFMRSEAVKLQVGLRRVLTACSPLRRYTNAGY